MNSGALLSPWLRSVDREGRHNWSVADVVRVRIRGGDYDELRNHLIRPEESMQPEYAAFLLAGTQTYQRGGGSIFEFLIREVQILTPDDYIEYSPQSVRIGAGTVRRMQLAAKTSDRRLDDLSVLMCHSHPESAHPMFSRMDDTNEPDHMASLTGEGNGPHGSLVFGTDGLTGRAWSADISEIRQGTVQSAATPIDEVVVLRDQELERIRTTDSRLPVIDMKEADRMRDRQALVHGTGGNARLRAAHVAVVGAGGLGSAAAQTLAHLGVGRLTVVDPDVVEESNRSRIVGSRVDDAGEPDSAPDEPGVIPAQWAHELVDCGLPKVDVVGRMVGGIDPDIEFCGVPDEVQEATAFAEVMSADVIFVGTDTATSRKFVSQGAKQYLRPLFEAGAVVKDDGAGGLKSMATSFYLSGANQPCLECMGRIKEERVDAEGEDPANLQYGLELVQGEQPSVITLNSQPVQRATFSIHRYLTGLLAGRTQFPVGTYLPIEGRTIDEPDGERDCIFCDGTLTASGDRGVRIGKANLYRTVPAALRDDLATEETPSGSASE